MNAAAPSPERRREGKPFTYRLICCARSDGEETPRHIRERSGDRASAANFRPQPTVGRYSARAPTSMLHVTRRPRDGVRGTSLAPRRHRGKMRKSLPEQMFIDSEKSRLTMLRSWVLDHQVTEIDMNERQFWNFAALQPLAEKPWTTFMGRVINVPDMPADVQKRLGIFNRNSPGMI
jgi:hypothetical protein